MDEQDKPGLLLPNLLNTNDFHYGKIKTMLFQNFGVLSIFYKFITVQKLRILYYAKIE